MEYRRITPAEFTAGHRLMAQCFHFENYKDPEIIDEKACENCFGGFLQDGTMTSFVAAAPEGVNYYGADAQMTKVGGVTCLPQYRQGGHMRHLLTQMLREVKKRGDHVAALYPFNHDFYRKFGFELCSVLQKVYIPMSQLAAFKRTGSVFAYEEGCDTAPYQKVWKNYTRKFLLSSLREKNWEKEWLNRLPQKPWESRNYAYLWKNDEGEAKGYIIFRFSKRQEGIVYEVTEFAYEDKEAFMGLLGFMKVMCAQGVAIETELPMEMPVMHLFPDPYVIKSELKAAGMARVVDIPFCMENKVWPVQSGKFTFRVTKDVLEENNGCYQMDFEKNLCEKIEDQKTDMTLTIQALSALCFGLSDVRVRNDIETENQSLLKLFMPRSVKFSEYF